MTDYTPSTEEIKTAWSALTHSPEAFERWLEQHDSENPRNGNNDTEIPETGKPKKLNLDQDIENAEHYVLEATKNLADAYLNYGKYKERERVIEILENNIIRYDRERNLIIQPTTPDFIALIKEEN